MSVETITSAPKQRAEDKQERRVLVRRVSTPAWLLRVFVESFFIMFSILMALAVDNWQENRQHRRLAQQTLQVFEREIRLNLATIEDLAPYHAGLRSVVAQALATPGEAADMRTIAEGLRQRLLSKLATRLTGAGELVLASDRFRDQPRNREDCLRKLSELAGRHDRRWLLVESVDEYADIAQRRIDAAAG